MSELPNLYAEGSSRTSSNRRTEKNSDDDNEDMVLLPSFDAAWMYCTHDTPRCETALREFEAKSELPPPVERAQVAQHLQRQRILAMLSKNYKRADQLYVINKKFASACVEVDNKNTQQNQLALINLRINEIEFAFHKKSEMFNQKIQLFRDQMEQKRTELKNIHAKELLKFDDYWSSEVALRRFSSPSQKLIELYKKEQALIVIHEFEEANRAKEEVARLEKEETEAAQANAEREAFLKRRALIDSQNDEIQKTFEQEEKFVNDVMIKKKREEQSYQIRLTKLLIDRDKGNFKVPTHSTLRESPRTSQIPMALTTPRTRQKLLAFRKSSTAPKLVLKPVKPRPQTTYERTRIIL